MSVSSNSVLSMPSGRGEDVGEHVPPLLSDGMLLPWPANRDGNSEWFRSEGNPSPVDLDRPPERGFMRRVSGDEVDRLRRCPVWSGLL